MKNKETKTTSKADITRILYTILYLVIGKFISMLIFIITIFQFVYSWSTGEANEKVLDFTNAMAEYSKQIVLYVGFNSDDKPWPVADWPSVKA